MAAGALALAGWGLDIEVLKGAGHSITMKPNAAVGLIICGLSLLAAELAQLHGGSVAASSDGPGRGSTFTVSLPLHQHISVL